MTVRVLIVDDHEIVRAGFVQFFENTLGIEVAAEAANGEELFLKLQTTQIDLLLLDMEMPGEAGLDLIRHIKTDYPDLRILIVSMHQDLTIVARALQAGASGYICKDCSPKMLVEAIHKIMSTGKYLSPMMAEQLAYASSFAEPSDNSFLLSNREMEVFRLLVEGNSNDEIAGLLFISDRTVSTHKTNLLNKLKLKNTVELVHYALQHKLFT
jgi:DNA-binding NarL/FixJ family response regulator